MKYSNVPLDPGTFHIEEVPSYIDTASWRSCRGCKARGTPGCPDEYAGAYEEDGCRGVIVNGKTVWPRE